MSQKRVNIILYHEFNKYRLSIIFLIKHILLSEKEVNKWRKVLVKWLGGAEKLKQNILKNALFTSLDYCIEYR